MEIKYLATFAILLVSVGMLLGIGLIVFDNFSQATQTTTAATNETIAFSSNQATLSKQHIVAITFLGNVSNSTTKDTTTFIIGTNIKSLRDKSDPRNGIINQSVNYIVDGVNYNVSYTYLANSTTSTTLDAVSSAIMPIATSWLALIVTVVVLSILIVLVLHAFGSNRR